MVVDRSVWISLLLAQVILVVGAFSGGINHSMDANVLRQILEAQSQPFNAVFSNVVEQNNASQAAQQAAMIQMSTSFAEQLTQQRQVVQEMASYLRSSGGGQQVPGAFEHTICRPGQ